MQHVARSALPEGVPPEGLKIIKATSEHELEERFAELASDGYVPAQRLKTFAHYDTDAAEWKTLHVLTVWKVGAGSGGETEEMFR